MKKVLEMRSSFIALYDNDGKFYLKAYAETRKICVIIWYCPTIKALSGGL